jgi:hypothetical protein
MVCLRNPGHTFQAGCGQGFDEYAGDAAPERIEEHPKANKNRHGLNYQWPLLLSPEREEDLPENEADAQDNKEDPPGVTHRFRPGF